MPKQTILYNSHQPLGARFVEFSGYSMPIWYTNAKDEHLAVRKSAGMFDISHMGMVIFNAANAGDILQKICTNDIQKTQPNKIIYTMILNHEGGILDDVMVGFNDVLGSYFMIINASNKDKIMSWMFQQGMSESDIDVRFDTHSLIAIQGPNAIKTVMSLFEIDWENLGRFQSQCFTYNGESCFVMRTGYTGEDGIEISCPNGVGNHIWDVVHKVGVTPCGLAARDSLRIEFGLPLYGHELSEDITPLHTRYQWVLKWGTGFIGEQALVEKKANIDTVTVGLVFEQRCLPRQGYVIKEGGVITSGSFSPVLNQPIAMAVIPKVLDGVGNAITVDIRGKTVKAVITKLPFV